jgi:hypothetical protein
MHTDAIFARQRFGLAFETAAVKHRRAAYQRTQKPLAKASRLA